MITTVAIFVVKIVAEVLLTALVKFVAEPLLMATFASAWKRLKKLAKKLMR